MRSAWNPLFDGKAALEAKKLEAVRTSQEVVEDLLERTRKVSMDRRGVGEVSMRGGGGGKH
jgi:hypothetical protein